MDTSKFIGMGIALVTPFTPQGEVDYEALARLIEYQLKGDADYFVTIATTAETPTLTIREEVDVSRFVAAQLVGRKPVVIGMGGNCTRFVVDKIRRTDLTPFDAILSVTPFYNKPTQEGLYEHYAAIAEASPIPVILYNVPGRTGVNLEAKTTLRLARDYRNIIAVKEASGNLTQIGDIIRQKSDNFLVISGDDGITLPLIEQGAAGVISVIGNAFPKEFSQMVHLALNGHYDEAELINERFKRLMNLLFVDGNPAGIKAILAEKGFISNTLRLPLVPVTDVTLENIRHEL